MNQNVTVQPAATPAPTQFSQGTSINTANQARIGKALVIKGEITGSESIWVDGRVEGSINLPEHRVTIGPEGQVFASITALEVVVQGKITGNVTVSGRLELRSEGSLTGDVVAERINVADGAFFKGKIEIVKAGQSAEGTNWAKNGRDISIVRDEPGYRTV